MSCLQIEQGYYYASQEASSYYTKSLELVFPPYVTILANMIIFLKKEKSFVEILLHFLGFDLHIIQHAKEYTTVLMEWNICGYSYTRTLFGKFVRAL